MRAFRIAYVLFSALVVFFMLNSVAGKLFPASKLPGNMTDSYDYYSKCSSLRDNYSGDVNSFDQAAYENQRQAYDKCIDDGQKAYEEASKNRYDTAGRDQIRNIYVVLAVMLIVFITGAFAHRRWPLLSAALVMGGLEFTLYFPTSNVVSGWYGSAFSMSEAVRSQLHNTVILASVTGFIAIVLISLLRVERAETATNAPVNQI